MRGRALSTGKARATALRPTASAGVDRLPSSSGAVRDPAVVMAPNRLVVALLLSVGASASAPPSNLPFVAPNRKTAQQSESAQTGLQFGWTGYTASYSELHIVQLHDPEGRK